MELRGVALNWPHEWDENDRGISPVGGISTVDSRVGKKTTRPRRFFVTLLSLPSSVWVSS